MEIKVMVVEHNVPLNRSTVNILQKEGYLAFVVTDLEAVREVFMEKKPHIVLLDIMFPQGYGYDLISYFRKQHDCWILVLTALEDIECKRVCYENGADDYLTKQFDLYELLYKLNAVKRRVLSTLREFQIGDIGFNVESNKLTCKDKSIVIQPSQVRFLKLLYNKYLENSYVDKSEALEDTSGELNETSRLQTLVARIRKNLSYIGSRQVDIETIYGKGYRILVKKTQN